MDCISERKDWKIMNFILVTGKRGGKEFTKLERG
jgi:hypothetical protein